MQLVVSVSFQGPHKDAGLATVQVVGVIKHKILLLSQLLPVFGRHRSDVQNAVGGRHRELS
jgi:hypothetical protein